MAKLTLSRKYQTFDAAQNLRREVYSYKKNTRELYFENVPILDDSELKPVPVETAPTAATIHSQTEIVPVAAQAPPRAVNVSGIPDSPILAAEIINLIVATALHKDAADLSNTSTIKGLSGGT
jgi:fatty acid synthase subunit alpha